MGIMARFLKAFEEEPKISKDFVAILQRRGISPAHVGRNGIDAYEFPARKVEIYGNGNTETVEVDRIMFGYGDTYITAFKGNKHREIESLFIKDVET